MLPSEIGFALFGEGFGELRVSISTFGLKLYGTEEMLDCLWQVSLACEGDAVVEVGAGVVRFETQG